MVKRVVKPSAATAYRARQNAICARLDQDAEYFRIDVLRRNKIVFFYGGYRIQFEPYYNTIVRRGGDKQYLTTEDYNIMFRLAKMIFRARDKGDQEAIKEKVSRPKSKRNDLSHLRQLSLFDSKSRE